MVAKAMRMEESAKRMTMAMPASSVAWMAAAQPVDDVLVLEVVDAVDEAGARREIVGIEPIDDGRIFGRILRLDLERGLERIIAELVERLECELIVGVALPNCGAPGRGRYRSPRYLRERFELALRIENVAFGRRGDEIHADIHLAFDGREGI